MRLVALLLVLWAGVAAAQPVPVRAGDHPAFGRIVFDWPSAPAYSVEQDGERVRVRFPPGSLGLDAMRRPPRNFVAVRAVEGGIEITLAPGARLRHFRNGAKVAFDALDGVAAAPVGATNAPAAAPTTAPATAPTTAPATAPTTAAAPAGRRERAAAAASALPAASVSENPGPTGRTGRRAAVTSAVAAVSSAAPTASASPLVAPPVGPPGALLAASLAAPVSAPPPGPMPAPIAMPAAAATRATPGGPADMSSSAPSTPPGASLGAGRSPAPGAAAVSSPSIAAPEAGAGPSLATPAPAARPGPPTPPHHIAAPPEAPPATGPDLPAALTLPFAPEAAAAMLRRGDSWLIVFDAPASMPLDAEPRPGARHQPIPGGALITLDAAAEWAGDWHLARRADGAWQLAPGDPPPTPPQHAAADAAGALAIAAPGAGRVLSVQDPVTGLPLLVGTQRAGGGLVATPREMVELRLLETRLGVAVLARSDAVVLRTGADRFTIAADGQARLALGSMPEARAATPVTASRSFDFPVGTTAELATRLRAQQSGLAQAPPLARGALRLAAAETLMAMGLPQEAQSMVQLAQAEDPAMAALPRAAWLGGAAALTANRLDEASALEAEPVSDEAALWRGLLRARQGDAAGAAEPLAAGRAILLGYPEPVLRRLLPQLAETLAATRPEIAEALLADAAGPGLELARAVLAEGQGHAEEALSAYDALSRGRDRRGRAEGLRRAAELRLALHQIEPAAAALQLEQTLFAWRDEGAEFTTRQRIAGLRSQGGDARGALALLRETATLFPEREASLQPAMHRAFAEALRQETPLNAVALHDAHPELMPAGAEGVAALATLAERLAALDLAGRATALLGDAMRRAPPGETRAALGARLAALQLGERQDVAAATTLAARAAGQPGGFAALGDAGDEALAEFLADRRDFAGAAAALGRHLDRALEGATAPLRPALLRAIVRHAALLALADDRPALARIRIARGALLAGTPAEAPFQLLATDPLRGLADLTRLPAELELFRTMPSRLDRLRTASAEAR